MIETIEKKCRTSLWTKKCSQRIKAPVAWENVYTQGSRKAFGVFNSELWNYSAVGKMLWAIYQ